MHPGATIMSEMERKNRTNPARLVPAPARMSTTCAGASLLARYGCIGLLRLARDILFTRIFFSGARIIRWPWHVRGMPHIRIGSGFTAGTGLRLDAFPDRESCVCISIGERVEVNDHVHIGAVESVTIGDDVLIASRVFITDHDHGCYGGDIPHSRPETRPADRDLVVSPVSIGNRAWLGEGVTVLPGVTIGAGAVIGANAVVTRDVPENCLAVGAPARVIKRYDSATNRWIRIEDVESHRVTDVGIGRV